MNNKNVSHSIQRVCISINQRCNLACSYCHFREKNAVILDKNRTSPPETGTLLYSLLDQILAYGTHPFKIGFVGNGEPFLDYPLLKSYIEYIRNRDKLNRISCYTITNGTISLAKEEWQFLKQANVVVGVSLDGPSWLHNPKRCHSFDKIMENLEDYYDAVGEYPTFNATVSKETLAHKEDVVTFFEKFHQRVTFSRLVGTDGISLEDYQGFLSFAEQSLAIRRGGDDCSMYGGSCGAGVNNFYFTTSSVYLCGNCMDYPPLGDNTMNFKELESLSSHFEQENYSCLREYLSKKTFRGDE